MLLRVLSLKFRMHDNMTIYDKYDKVLGIQSS